MLPRSTNASCETMMMSPMLASPCSAKRAVNHNTPTYPKVRLNHPTDAIAAPRSAPTSCIRVTSRQRRSDRSSRWSDAPNTRSSIAGPGARKRRCNWVDARCRSAALARAALTGRSERGTRIAVGIANSGNTISAGCTPANNTSADAMLMPSEAVRVSVKTARINWGPAPRTSASWSRYSGVSRCAIPGMFDTRSRVLRSTMRPTRFATTCSASLIARPAEPTKPAPRAASAVAKNALRKS